MSEPVSLSAGESEVDLRARVGGQVATPVPEVVGPVPITSSSRPFMTEVVDLASRGYILEEYFVRGAANVYDWGRDGVATTPRVRTADAPYATRILVRKPLEPGRFSGNVWVELSNPSRNYDVELEWCAAGEKFIRDGDIHVALTIKPVAIAALQRFDTQRYGSLSIANPLPPEQQTTGLLPGEDGYDENASKLYENGLAWDIISQVGALMRNPAPAGPLAGYPVRHVFATGVSQTGFYLNTWAANFSTSTTLPPGIAIYDGIVSIIGAGKMAPINQSLPATGPGDPRSALPRGHVPFMRVDTQSEPLTLDGYKTRRADSDDADDPYRSYEIAGASHGWSDIYSHQPSREDIAATGGVAISFQTCAEARWNSLPRQFFEPGMLTNMERWVINGQRPPRQPEPLRLRDLHTATPSFETDEFGNALGGMRTPYVDVPTATYHDRATDSHPRNLGRFFGHEVRFTSQRLELLYASQNDYVAKVSGAVQRLLDEHWLEEPEAVQIIERARHTPIP